MVMPLSTTLCHVVKETTESLIDLIIKNTEKRSESGSVKQTGGHVPPQIGLGQLPAQRENLCRSKGGKFSMILAGCGGTGKTTFLDTLVCQELQEPEETTLQFPEIREGKFELTEDTFTLKLTVVCMPGFGARIDNQNSWLPIAKYIDHQFKSYLLQEEQPDRSELKDNRVHVCLYFLPPSNSQLSQLDIESMKEISMRVNLIPVVSRSDTLNKEELASFKKIVNTTLTSYEIHVCKFISDPSVLEKINAAVPYAVVGSNSMYTNSEGQLVRARKYHWGMVEIENPDHCDFLKLREVLMSEHMLDLITSTESHYNVYRQRCLQERLERVAVSLRPKEFQDITKEDVTNINGLRAYSLYKKVKPFDKVVLDVAYPRDENLVSEETKAALREASRREELRNRKRKVKLILKQKAYNDDLEDCHQIINQLQEDIKKLSTTGNDVLRDLEKESGNEFGKKSVIYCYEDEFLSDDDFPIGFRFGSEPRE